MKTLSPIERAIREACATVDVDHGSNPGGELPDCSLDQLYSALASAGEGALATVALRTAALACVEPQLPEAVSAAVQVRLGANEPLAADGSPSSVAAPATVSRRQRAALDCVVAA